MCGTVTRPTAKKCSIQVTLYLPAENTSVKNNSSISSA
jgi:hypothetical protein